MPKYVYLCNECEGEFEVRHSLRETIEICQFCGITDKLVRRPFPIFLNKKKGKLETKNTPGIVVKETIEEIRQDLKAEQERLTKREYKK